MDRKGIIAVTLAILTLVGWMFWNQQEMQKAAALQSKAKAEALEAAAKEKLQEVDKKGGETAGTGGKGATGSPSSPGNPAPAETVKPAEPAVPEKIETLSTSLVEYAFSNLGGGITTARLKTHEAERGTRMVLNEFGAIPIGAVTEFAGEGTRAPFTATSDPANGTTTFEGSITGLRPVVDPKTKSTSYEHTDSKPLQLTKRFTVSKGTGLDKEYFTNLEITFTNRSAQPLGLPAYFVHTGSSAPVHQKDLATYTGFMWDGGKFMDANSFSSGWFSKGFTSYTTSRENIAWAGVADQYFTTMVIPQVTSKDPAAEAKQRGASVWTTRFVINDAAWKESGRSAEGNTATRYAVDGALGMPAFTLEPGQSLTQSFRIYSGPREYGRLRLMPDGEADIMNFGKFGFVSKILLNSMNLLHGLLGSYAAAIIVLTLVIKCLLWPMQNKSTQSMKKMQLLQPKMTELKEKYKDDPVRMNTELPKLYRDYGVNPLAGCLPMAVQLPVFWGFYSMLGTAIELRNSKFLWVHDLSQPDTLFHLPGVGWPVNVLPLCMAATMFWQMSISPKSGDATQQRMFMIMPLMFVWFCYSYPCALALYWTVQNLFSVVQLYVTRNQAPPTLQKVAAPGKKK